MTDNTLEKLVDQMTLDEQVTLLSGAGYWHIAAIERLGIGSLVVSDGPNGARGGGSLFGGTRAACFPVGIGLGATWDPDLVGQIAAAIAQEMKAKGAHVALAPTINIQRTALNGRNFECHSEDPELAAALAVAYVRGLQENGIAATPKHFAGNESEIARTTVDTRADERTLREVYLRPFEAAVRDGGAWSMMTAYNKLNGTYAAEHHWLLTEVLRGEWGFDGAIMSDWYGSRSTAPTIHAGLDIEMPGPARDRGETLVAAVEAGEVSAGAVRAAALNVLRLIARTGAMTNLGDRVEREDDRPATRDLIRRAGAAGAVLLCNDGILPLEGAPRIAVIGPNARVARVMGGGSSQLNAYRAVTPWEGLAERFGGQQLHYAPGCTNHRWEPLIHSDFTVEYFANQTLSGDPVHVGQADESQEFWAIPVAGGHVDPMHFSARITGQIVAEETGTHRLGLHVAGYARVLVDGQEVLNLDEKSWRKGRTFFEEGNDEVVVDVALTAGAAVPLVIEYRTKLCDNLDVAGYRVGLSRPLGQAEIDEAARLAADCEVALVFAGRSGEWDTEGSDLADMRLPGAQDALIAAVARANPRTVVVLQTGGPVEMPWLDDVAAVLQAWYPGQECGHAIADVLSGMAEPGGRLPQTFPARVADTAPAEGDASRYPGVDGAVHYSEGVFHGYRHFDRAGIAPLFPFGHGLGYTTFAMDGIRVSRQDDKVVAQVKLRNTGARDGSTIVQLYVAPPGADHRPVRELEGFARVSLPPGATTEIEIALSPRAFAWFDEALPGWRIEAGRYRLEAGFSSRDIGATTEVDIEAATYPPDHAF